jgi:hypothetical protein
VIKYSWRIDEMLRAAENGHERVVTLIRWTLIAADKTTGTEATLTGALTPPMPDDGAAFTAFADLTREQVEAWLDAQPGVADWRAGLAFQLAAPAPAFEAAPLPWLT